MPETDVDCLKKVQKSTWENISVHPVIQNNLSFILAFKFHWNSRKQSSQNKLKLFFPFTGREHTSLIINYPSTMTTLNHNKKLICKANTKLTEKRLPQHLFSKAEEIYCQRD